MKLSSRLPVSAALIFGLTGCTNPASKLPLYDHVPDFAMVNSEGRPFTAQQMQGGVWIVDFIYTNCPAECPRMSSQLHKLKEKMKNDAGVQFLSISVDPERDTPAALHVFANRWGAPDTRWTFITGTPQTVHLLAYTTFHVGDVIDKIEHSTQFALVDSNRTIRGYYSSFDPESLAQLQHDATDLSRSVR